MEKNKIEKQRKGHKTKQKNVISTRNSTQGGGGGFRRLGRCLCVVYVVGRVRVWRMCVYARVCVLVRIATGGAKEKERDRERVGVCV